MLKLGIDLDGVLANFTERFVTVVNSIWPNRLPKDYVPSSWKYTEAGITDADMKLIWQNIEGIKNFWLGVSPLEENVRPLFNWILRHPEVEVYFVTSRARTAGLPLLEQCNLWLKGRNVSLDFKNTSVIPVEHTKGKTAIFDSLGIDFSIDDYDVNVREALRYSLEQTSILNPTHSYKKPLVPYLLDQPWNRDAHDLDAVRVSSMTEFLKKVEEGSK